MAFATVSLLCASFVVWTMPLPSAFFAIRQEPSSLYTFQDLSWLGSALPRLKKPEGSPNLTPFSHCFRLWLPSYRRFPFYPLNYKEDMRPHVISLCAVLRGKLTFYFDFG